MANQKNEIKFSNNKQKTKKTKIVIWLEEDEKKDLDKIAEVLTEVRKKEDIKNKVPPSKRGRKVSRSKTSRQMMLEGMKWSGYLLDNKD